VVAFANCGHGDFVEIGKRFCRLLALKLAPNQFASVASLLHCNLSNSRQRFSILIERRGIADHENFRMIWNSTIGLDKHATAAIGLRPQPFSSGGRRNSDRPDPCVARYSCPPHNDSCAVDLLDRMAQTNFDSELL